MLILQLKKKITYPLKDQFQNFLAEEALKEIMKITNAKIKDTVFFSLVEEKINEKIFYL